MWKLNILEESLGATFVKNLLLAKDNSMSTWKSITRLQEFGDINVTFVKKTIQGLEE